MCCRAFRGFYVSGASWELDASFFREAVRECFNIAIRELVSCPNVAPRKTNDGNDVHKNTFHIFRKEHNITICVL